MCNPSGDSIALKRFQISMLHEESFTGYPGDSGRVFALVYLSTSSTKEATATCVVENEQDLKKYQF